MNLFTLSLDNTEKQPLYRQLYQFIVDEIKDGNLKEGEKLPSKRTLKEHLKVSQNTIETAYDMLLAEGYISSKPRSGYFVCRYEQVELLPAQDDSSVIKEFEELQPIYPGYDLRSSAIETEHFPFSTWARITKDIMYNEVGLLSAGHGQGDYSLREVLRHYLHVFRGVNCFPEQIVIGAGTEYLLDIIAQLLGEQTSYALENPCYQKTHYILRNNNCQITPIDVTSTGMNLSQLQESQCNVAYVTPSHQFPTGVTMPIGHRTKLLQWAGEQPGRYIIEDDYDSEFGFNGRPIPSLQGLDHNGKVIYIGTFSRSIAPSIRISYMILPPELHHRYRLQFANYSSTVSRFEQATLEQFIQGGHLERHLNKMRTIYNKKKEAFLYALKSSSLSDSIHISGDHAGLHFLLQVNNGMTEQQLIASAEEENVRVYGISDYYIEDNHIPNATLVIGYAGIQQTQIPDIIKSLINAWIPEIVR